MRTVLTILTLLSGAGGVSSSIAIELTDDDAITTLMDDDLDTYLTDD